MTVSCPPSVCVRHASDFILSIFRVAGLLDYSALLKSKFLQDWVQRSFALLDTERQNAQLYAFTLRLLALLMENEWQFLEIMDTDVLIR